MGKIRFEVRLPIDEAERVFADMRERGAASKANHVRDCLLANRAGRADRLTEQLGLLGMTLNEIAASEMRNDGEMEEELARMRAAVAGLLRRIVRDLNRGDVW